MALSYPFFSRLRRIFKAVPLSEQPATQDEIVTAPIEAISLGQHVGPIFRTPPNYPPHT